MLNWAGRLAQLLRPWRWLLWTLLTLACALLGSVLALAWPAGEGWLAAALIGVLWSLSLLSFVHLFSVIPAWPETSVGWWRRSKLALGRMVLRLVLLVVVLSSLAVVMLSARLISVTLMNS